MGPGRTDWTDRAAVLRSWTGEIFFPNYLESGQSYSHKYAHNSVTRAHIQKISDRSTYEKKTSISSTCARAVIVGKNCAHWQNDPRNCRDAAMASVLARCCSTPRSPLPPLLEGCRNNYRAETRPSLPLPRPTSQPELFCNYAK